MDKCSALIICQDEENNIKRALESVSWCDEVVVVDSGSTDKTVDIAKELGAKVFFHKWQGYVKQKEWGLKKCRFKWVINIDADEEVSSELRDEIRAILSLPPHQQKDGYKVCRIVFYLGRWWDKYGWGKEYRVRFFQKRKVLWGGREPHEKVVVNGSVGILRGFLHHYTYKSVKDQVEKALEFGHIVSDRLLKEGKKATLLDIAFRPIIRFVKFFILKRAFLAGTDGFIAAVNEAYSVFIKYALLREKRKRKEVTE